MAAKRFKSKMDRWIFAVLGLTIALVIVTITGVIAAQEDPIVTTTVVLMFLGLIAFLASILVATHYTVDRGELRIVSGPFRWRVPVTNIDCVRATRSPFSSPALSLDRLRIEYNGARSIMVSPADRRGFLRAIGQDLAD